MAHLKRIPADGIKEALDKAAHYRLLNEPHHAESICLDVLEVDQENQRALITLLLALTDQFPDKLYDAYHQAEALVQRLTDEYNRYYYDGIVNERWASTQMSLGTASKSLSTWIGRAMNCYEHAEKLSDSKNPDPILRWNTCVRLQQQIVTAQPAHAPLSRDLHSEFGEDVPPR